MYDALKSDDQPSQACYMDYFKPKMSYFFHIHHNLRATEGFYLFNLCTLQSHK